MIMKKYIGILLIAVIAVVALAGCEKKIESIDTYSVKVEFRNTGSKYLTSDVTLNPKDSIYFDFSITANEDMDYVEIQRNGSRIDTFRLPASNRRSFSKVKGYVADSAAGDYEYRIIGRSSIARYLGDGDKKIKVTITPDFTFWSYRVMKVPDTVAKTNKAYYAISTGNTYSYSEGAANSAQIDFGYYYDTTGTFAGGSSLLGHSIYALSTAQPQLNFYDISTWTKNATVFRVLSGANFVNITSKGAIYTVVKNNMASGTAQKVNKLVSGSVIGFKTVSGKYGAILIRYVNQNSAAKETYADIDVKLEK
jgi:hypothetical protein